MSETVHVLYVDDSEGATETTTTLERENDRFTVERATRTTDTLARLTEDIDCIVAEYTLPDGDGVQLLTRVRETYPDLPFVLFTDSGDERIASEAISAGVSEYIRKGGPESNAVLATRIEELVARSQSQKAARLETERYQEDERYRQRLLAITRDSETTPEEKTRRLLALGCDRFGTENGHLVKIDRDSGRHEVISASGSDIISEGVSDLSMTYCRRTIESQNVLDIYNAPAQGWEDDPAYRNYGLSCYIGQKLLVDGKLYGTLCFANEEPRGTAFSQDEKAFMNRLAEWFSQLLERRRYRAQAETMFEQTQDALFLIDVTPEMEFRVRRVNTVYEELTGLSTADLRGERPEEKGIDLERHYERCVETREPTEYEETLEVGTQRRHLQTKLSPVIEDGEVVQLVGATRDVTRQREREQLLTVRTRAMEKAPVGITISDPTQADNPLIYVNEQYEQATGYSKDEAVGRNCRFLQGEQTSDAPVEQIREAIAANEEVSVELRNYRKDGTEFWNQVKIAPVFDGSGTLTHFAGYQQDITERVIDKQQLEAQNERLDRLAAVISHDLRNPLSAAQVQADLAKQTGETEPFEALHEAHDRMEQMIDELLTMARARENVEESESVSLTNLVQRAWETAETPGAELTVDLPWGFELDANPDLLCNVLENLFRNAADHNDPPLTVTVGTLGDENSPVGFYVEDDGTGIPASSRDRIFEYGYTTDDDGTGFGLSIVEEFVEAHGWELSVTEGTDGGARFDVRTTV